MFEASRSIGSVMDEDISTYMSVGKKSPESYRLKALVA